MIALINYGMGNLRSVMNAFAAVGAPVEVLDRPHKLKQATRVVLPGVGAFGDGMGELKRGGWIESLKEEVLIRQKPFLGLCLGMQLLAAVGTEHGTHAGLGWIEGSADRLPEADARIRIPHIGWNDVRVLRRGGLYKGLPETPVFYFVHSYALKPASDGVVSGLCEHGVSFAASVERENIWATQFHPEKSQKDGLRLLKNFADFLG